MSNRKDSSSNNDQSEVGAAEEVINSLNYYNKYVLIRLKRHADAIRNMSVNDRNLIDHAFLEHVKRVRQCSEINQSIFKLMIEAGVTMMDDDHFISKGKKITQLRPSSEHYMSKVRSTLKQIVRDWSIDERSTCYDLILDEISNLFPDFDTRHQCDILVPGAGLGRFAWELRKKGFSVTGNEFSIYMLLASNFLLNCCKEPNTFSMCAGDFREAFADEFEKFHCVATIFFLDTALNPIQYIRLIHQILVKGGVWLNYGPLTYHYEDSLEEPSLELPFDEIVKIVEKIGFKMDKVIGKNQLPDSKYTLNPDSMLQYNYKCGYFMCTKKSNNLDQK